MVRLPDPPVRTCVHRLAPVAQRGQRPLRVRQQRASGIGQARTLAGPHEELAPQRTLQRLDARGERRLGDEEHLSGARDRARARDLHERLDAGKVQRLVCHINVLYIKHR